MAPESLTIGKHEAARILGVSLRTFERIRLRARIGPVGARRRPLAFSRDTITALAAKPFDA